MSRRTKIVATLGPATTDPKVLKKLIAAGVDVVRLNFSHGVAQDHIDRAETIRQAAAAAGRPIAILADLQGPKIRIDKFVDGAIELAEGDKFILDTQLDKNAGTQISVGVTYKALAEDVNPGDVLLLDDGRLEFEVDKIVDHKIYTTVLVGGKLSNNKGINLRGGGLSAPAITEKDREDIITAAKIGCDYLAISFPRTAADIHRARDLLEKANCKAGIIAKIERYEALDVIDEIIKASDGIMVARGDLGVEIGDAELPAVQKRLISKAHEHNRVVITATQMMESMIENPIPTRAEVFDVANAVLDGTDAVMLSAETASGKYPIKVVEAMARVCSRVEKEPEVSKSSHRINSRFQHIAETIAMSAMYAANHFNIKAIIALTESGKTALTMSRIRSSIPIYALTHHDHTVGRVCLYRGVQPIKLTESTIDHAKTNLMIVNLLKEKGYLEDGDLVIITKGDLMGTHGGTNAMKIVEVGNMLNPENINGVDS